MIWEPASRAVMSEWLRRLTRNQLGSARAGSNPADCGAFYFFGEILSENVLVSLGEVLIKAL